jgi:hypothetical protein
MPANNVNCGTSVAEGAFVDDRLSVDGSKKSRKLLVSVERGGGAQSFPHSTRISQHLMFLPLPQIELPSKVSDLDMIHRRTVFLSESDSHLISRRESHKEMCCAGSFKFVVLGYPITLELAQRRSDP